MMVLILRLSGLCAISARPHADSSRGEVVISVAVGMGSGSCDAAECSWPSRAVQRASHRLQIARAAHQI